MSITDSVACRNDLHELCPASSCDCECHEDAA